MLGIEEISPNSEINDIPVTGLNPSARYEKMAEAFGGNGYYVKTHEELSNSLKKAI